MRPLLPPLLVLLGLVLGSGRCLGMPEGETRPRERLIPVPGGYLAISSIEGFTGLRRYNDSLSSGTQTYLRNVRPLDVSFRPGMFRPDSALLVGGSGADASIYTVNVRGTPSFSLFWSGQVPAIREIVALTGGPGGNGAVALAGDSIFMVIRADRVVTTSMTGDLAGAVLADEDSLRFIVASREEAGIRLRLVDGVTGRTLESGQVPWSREVVMRMITTEGVDQLAVVTRERPYRAFLFDPNTLLAADPVELTDRPEAIVPCLDGNVHGACVLFRSYPIPTYLPLLSDPTTAPVEIDYPLREVFASAADDGGLIALIGRDSLALYDSAMTLLTVLPAGDLTNARMHRLPDGRLLLASATGSRILPVPPEPPDWFSRHWRLIFLAAAGVVIAAAIASLLRHHLFIRNIYNNLVLVPSSHGIIVMSQSQRVRHINGSARRLLGIAAYIPLGRHISEYLTADEWRPALESLRGLFAYGDSFIQKIDLERDGDHRSYSFSGRPMFAASGVPAGYLLMVEDVTKTIERERLVNWASVAHHIAHEMKTPLGTVTVTAEMLYDRLAAEGAESTLLRSTSRIVRQSERLRDIVEDLLTIARTESLKKVRADMGIVLSSVAHDCAEYIPSSIELRLDVSGSDLHCMADVSQLTVAIRNLIDNAWQAIGSRDGGCIFLRAVGADAHVVITIRDTGIGMSRETLTKLFQPFYTEREGGSGIGTVIIKRVIEAHGGTIAVDSEVGIGTTFTLHMPRL